MVVVSDNAYPGWRASIDGQPSQIYTAYTAIRGIVVGPGHHHIEMVYRPASVYVGLALTLFGVIATYWLSRRPERSGPDLLRGARM
jgi:uncharacterized membrane protein YfhO